MNLKELFLSSSLTNTLKIKQFIANLQSRIINISARINTGTLMLCIPEHIALQLQLETHNQREVTVANGQKQMVPYVAPVELAFENRTCFVGALVLGDEVLLDPIPMEDIKND